MSIKIYNEGFLSQVLATGQTTSYHAGDDGDLQLGIAPGYTVLTTGQYTGTTNVTLNGKTYAFPNACVQNGGSGKMWARTIPQSDIGPATNGCLFWDQYTLNAETCTCNAAAKTFTADAGTPFSTGALCAGRKFTIAGSVAGNNGTFTVTNITTSVITVSETVVNENSIALDFATSGDLIWDLIEQVNANSLAGYTDWRVPNIKELDSVTDFEHHGPSINETIFPSTPTTQHWTSTSYAGINIRAWYVLFSTGGSNFSDKKKYKYHIRLVRK